jgi:hypothetical protein
VTVRDEKLKNISTGVKDDALPILSVVRIKHDSPQLLASNRPGSILSLLLVN